MLVDKISVVWLKGNGKYNLYFYYHSSFFVNVFFWGGGGGGGEYPSGEKWHIFIWEACFVPKYLRIYEKTKHLYSLILSRDSNYIVDVFMRPKFSNCRISMRGVRNLNSIRIWPEKPLEGWSWFTFNNLGLALGTNMKFYTSVSKGLKLKFRKFWRLIPTFVQVTGEKLVGEVFLPHPLPPLPEQG